jgi:hypothetical protein
MEGVIVVLTIFASFVLIAYIYFSTRNKERMALIEKGESASLFKIGRKPFSVLKWGMFLVGIGIGILVGNILAVSTNLEEPVPYFSMILLFGGGSLIAYHLIERNREKTE